MSKIIPRWTSLDTSATVGNLEDNGSNNLRVDNVVTRKTLAEILSATWGIDVGNKFTLTDAPSADTDQEDIYYKIIKKKGPYNVCNIW